MNEIFDIMLDVSKLVTGGSDIARAEARRIAAERERRAAENAQSLALLPATIVAVGGATEPVERLMTLQSAIAKAVGMVAAVGRLRLRLPDNGLLRFRLR